jgi:hypothetical protein
MMAGGATGSDVTSGIFLFPLSPRPFLTKEKDKEERERERGRGMMPRVASLPVAPHAAGCNRK